MDKDDREPRDSDGGCTHNDLTPDQAEEARLLIDNIGGDTWNEGDYDWRFTAVRCDFSAQVCALEISVASHDAPAQRFPRGGNVYGVARYVDMVTGDRSGSRHLVPEFYSKVAALVEYLEKTMPRP